MSSHIISNKKISGELQNLVEDQAAPVQNTWYELVNEPNPLDLFFMAVGVRTTGETLDARVTINGTAYTKTGIAAAAGSLYALYFSVDAASGMYIANGAANTVTNANPWAGNVSMIIDSLKIEVRKTTAAGAGNLFAIADYSKL